MKFLDLLIKYWPVVVVLVLGTASVGAGEYRVKNLEEAMSEQVQQNKKLHEVEVNQAVIQEQLKSIEKFQQLILDEIKK